MAQQTHMDPLTELCGQESHERVRSRRASAE
jgi:hypothetical protein